MASLDGVSIGVKSAIINALQEDLNSQFHKKSLCKTVMSSFKKELKDKEERKSVFHGVISSLVDSGLILENDGYVYWNYNAEETQTLKKRKPNENNNESEKAMSADYKTHRDKVVLMSKVGCIPATLALIKSNSLLMKLIESVFPDDAASRDNLTFLRSEVQSTAFHRRSLIPIYHPWRNVQSKCPNLIPIDGISNVLIDIDRPVIEALRIIEKHVDQCANVFPGVISRMYCGGKTTLLRKIFSELRERDEYYPIICTFSNDYVQLEDESCLQSVIRVIAVQLIDTLPHQKREDYECNEESFVKHLDNIQATTGKRIVLLIDQLNKTAVRNDVGTKVFLRSNFLDRVGRYLIFTSNTLFGLGAPDYKINASFSRGVVKLRLPFCVDKKELRKLKGCSELTDVQVTLYSGYPSLLYLQNNRDHCEMTLQQRFIHAVRRRPIQKDKKTALRDFLREVIDGEQVDDTFEPFSDVNYNDNILTRYPLPIIPVILKYLDVPEASQFYNNLCIRAESEESGKGWEVITTFAIYLQGLLAMHENVRRLKGPFGIADRGVSNVECLIMSAELVQSVHSAEQYIKKEVRDLKVLYIITPAYNAFPVFDGFLAYRTKKRFTVYAFQNKEGKKSPNSDVPAWIDRAFYLNGKANATDKFRDTWEILSETSIKELLGFSLKSLYPDDWTNIEGFKN